MKSWQYDVIGLIASIGVTLLAFQLPGLQGIALLVCVMVFGIVNFKAGKRAGIAVSLAILDDIKKVRAEVQVTIKELEKLENGKRN